MSANPFLQQKWKHAFQVFFGKPLELYKPSCYRNKNIPLSDTNKSESLEKQDFDMLSEVGLAA